MEKTYVTTVKTTWEIRGDVTPEQINDSIRTALNTVMMTPSPGSDNYAFTGSDHLLELKTTEVPPRTISDELREKILNDQDFLSEFAHMSFMGDGLEYDHASVLLADESDDQLCDDYCTYCGRNKEIIDELKKIGKYSDEFDGFDEEEEN